MMISYLKKLANSKNPNSFANKMRRKRMRFFEAFFARELSYRKVEILDLGGTWNYWKQMGYENKNNVQITLLNLSIQESFSGNIRSISGDACDLSEFPDKCFDIVFSNSVIEHVGDFHKQEQMANEIMRVGKSFYVQTPNYWFPMEPHFLILGFQFLPLHLRAFLLQNLSFGWRGKHKSRKEALKVADSIKLLSKRKLMKLFPNAIIKNENFAFLTKSYILVHSIEQ
ncbi:MAG: methyltransferase domain-containing protein [Candidatus Saccharimonadaceae bacterium]